MKDKVRLRVRVRIGPSPGQESQQPHGTQLHQGNITDAPKWCRMEQSSDAVHVSCVSFEVRDVLHHGHAADEGMAAQSSACIFKECPDVLHLQSYAQPWTTESLTREPLNYQTTSRSLSVL